MDVRVRCDEQGWYAYCPAIGCGVFQACESMQAADEWAATHDCDPDSQRHKP